MERGAVRLLSPNGDPLREALYSNQKAVALETGAVTTAITPREQRWPRSISIFRCLEELQMTVTMEDSQSVVMKKHMPELEGLQLRKEKREKEAGEEGEDKIQVKQVTPNPRTAQLKGYGFISLSHSTLFSLLHTHYLPALCQVQGVQSQIQPALLQGKTHEKECSAGGTSPLEQSGETH